MYRAFLSFLVIDKLHVHCNRTINQIQTSLFSVVVGMGKLCNQCWNGGDGRWSRPLRACLLACMRPDQVRRMHPMSDWLATTPWARLGACNWWEIGCLHLHLTRAFPCRNRRSAWLPGNEPGPHFSGAWLTHCWPVRACLPRAEPGGTQKGTKHALSGCLGTLHSIFLAPAHKRIFK